MVSIAVVTRFRRAFGVTSVNVQPSHLSPPTALRLPGTMTILTTTHIGTHGRTQDRDAAPVAAPNAVGLRIRFPCRDLYCLVRYASFGWTTVPRLRLRQGARRKGPRERCRRRR